MSFEGSSTGLTPWLCMYVCMYAGGGQEIGMYAGSCRDFNKKKGPRKSDKQACPPKHSM